RAVSLRPRGRRNARAPLRSAPTLFARRSPSAVLQIAQHFAGSAFTCLDRAVQVALEVLRRVLAGEVAVALPLLLHPGELRVLPDLPVRVGALRPWVAGPEVDRRAAAPVVRADVRNRREDRLQLGHELL